MRTPTHIMIHHSATQDGRQFSTRAIRAFHTSWRFQDHAITPERAKELQAQGVKGLVAPWRKIGYHRLVELVDTEVECIVGRGEHESAAACPQGEMNEKALHICLIGNFDLAGPSDAMVKVAIERAVAPWRMVYGIPVERIVAHHDFNPAKTCPGIRFDMDLFREMCR